MNIVLLAGLGLLGVSSAVAARRILAEKRRRHREWRRSGSFIPSEATSTKGGAVDPSLDAALRNLLRELGLSVTAMSAYNVAHALHPARATCGAPGGRRCTLIGQTIDIARQRFGGPQWDLAMRDAGGEHIREGEEEEAEFEYWEQRMGPGGAIEEEEGMYGVGNYEFNPRPIR